MDAVKFIEGHKSYAEAMLLVLDALPMTTIIGANLALLWEMKQQSKLNCWRNGLLHTLARHGRVCFWNSIQRQSG